MSPGFFAIALILGSALLALWIISRFAGIGPKSLGWAIVHVVAACALLRAVPPVLERLGESGMPGIQFIEVFGMALPALVYGFVSGGWMTRLTLGLLRP
ncbi:MAG TPA: hypothetical protein VFU10_03435 [Gaiellaceae bacterium]|nr:hypothetical protein [Gaiellaceae bacterium]